MALEGILDEGTQKELEVFLARIENDYRAKHQDPINNILLLLANLYETYKKIHNDRRKLRISRLRLAGWELALHNFELEPVFSYLRTEYPSVLPGLQKALEANTQHHQQYLNKRKESKK